MARRNCLQSIANNTVQHLLSRNFAIDDGYNYNFWAYHFLCRLVEQIGASSLTLQLTPNIRSEFRKYGTVDGSFGAEEQAVRNLGSLSAYLKSFERRQLNSARIAAAKIHKSSVEFTFSTIDEVARHADIEYWIMTDLGKQFVSSDEIKFALINENHQFDWVFRKRD